MKKLAVVALGGNALLRGDQQGTIDEQEANIYETCTYLLQLIKNDYNLVIGHGNGPQVGNVLLQHEAGSKMFGIPKMPIDICVAETQGSIGYMIEQQLRNVLEKENLQRDIISIITQAMVEKNDPAFKNPTKPVGPYYSKEEADAIAEKTAHKFAEDPRGRGWRRVVPSPSPKSINNRHSIETLVRDGQIVIAVGGGGIPYFYVEPNKLQGIDAVIDKDLASSMLAAQINADEFFILTDVEKVYLNFRKPDEKELDTVTVSEAKKYLEEEHFSKGSMEPKIQACIQFVEKGGKQAVITQAYKLGDPGAGTKIVRD